jgi:hypothetical protein
MSFALTLGSSSARPGESRGQSNPTDRFQRYPPRQLLSVSFGTAGGELTVTSVSRRSMLFLAFVRHIDTVRHRVMGIVRFR